MPAHCFSSPRDTPTIQDVYFTVKFNPNDTTEINTNYTTQDEVDNGICLIDWSTDTGVPTNSNYTRLGSTILDTALGMSLSGIMVFNGDSINNMDPFYPQAWGNYTTVETESVDTCLMHPQGQGIFHYHMITQCIKDYENW